jgi:soluble lytic murein transglycosylase-like protein
MHIAGVRIQFVAALLLALLLLATAACTPVYADVPYAAKPYQRTLIRTAHAQWGLDAPIATFAAQIHQESAWQPTATSWVGAQGLAQFMPATAAWIINVFPELKNVDPYNPSWSMRAMVRYDQWLHARLKADTLCDKWAMVLSAYNGGLGWVLRDKTLAAANGDSRWLWWDNIERHNAGRSAANFSENRDYPRRILAQHEPQYIAAGWGRGVCAARFSL